MSDDDDARRERQADRPADAWRPLRDDEIEILARNGNRADDWTGVLVAEGFDPRRVRNCEFGGRVRIGKLDDDVLAHDGLRLPVGIVDSRIVDSDIGDNAAVHHVRVLARTLVGPGCILLNVDEMCCAADATFGNGAVADDREPSGSIPMAFINEGGGRTVAPFDGMTAGDAYLWARYRHDAPLMDALAELTRRQRESVRGLYGTVGAGSVLRSCRIVHDVRIGPAARISGCEELRDLTVNSLPEAPVEIGPGAILVGGILGPGSSAVGACEARRFVLGSGTRLESGAVLIESYLGDNSTVACCEIRNSLVFSSHEQHHRSSFLIAAMLQGQSSLAAGATIGSNHNSRAHDGELHAGRGFWPGLCVSLKHHSRFASFCLLTKGAYPAELDIPLPFSLVSNDTAHDQLRVMPAYWWMYNLYALARTPFNLRARSRRKVRTQHIEMDYLAPDTVEEIFVALDLLERWTAEAALRDRNEPAAGKTPEQLQALGRELLRGAPERTADLRVLAGGLERSNSDALILRPRQAYHAYRQMLHHYAMSELVGYLRDHPEATIAAMGEDLRGPRRAHWINLGGQPVAAEDLDAVRAKITAGELATWESVHRAWDALWEEYPRDRRRHALAALLDLLEADALTGDLWRRALDEAVAIQEHLAEQVYRTRKKDDDNPFRRALYECPEEMRAVLGTAEDNAFIRQVREEAAAFAELVERIRRRD